MTSASRTADAIIIGGGLHGCSTALQLAMRGMSVIIIEKDYVGRHASGVNAGGVRRLGRDLAEVPLSVESAKMWHDIESLVGDDCGFVASRQIKVAETEEHMVQLQNRVQQVKALGFDHEKMIDQKELREKLPAISDHCVGGLIVEGDGSANPFRTSQAFRRQCESLGVQLKENTVVSRFEKKEGVWHIHTSMGKFESPNLVNCAGAWGGKMAEMLGESVPIDTRAPMLMITSRIPPFIDSVVGVQGRPLSFKQFVNGTVLIGGGHVGKANPDTNETLLKYEGLAINANIAMTLFPQIRHAKIVRSWAGIEGYLPDNIPVISKSNIDGAFHSFGYSAHGFQMSPIAGKILSELIIDGKSELSIDAFSINRFSNDSLKP
ncbi:FAD-binding oxidoreductase [Marinomonas sp. C1424]|uniref:FAD-binding oxidoreductase n=1 Tax=Marinomonas transparens TaxID=2795388 RepID=A0A934JV80_9GAMM|nr:FAD-binding oxidoreductase [Marinomonas transparens]